MDGRGAVVAVARRPDHALSKHEVLSIRLLEGRGVEGDAHCGPEVRHRSRRRANPELPNLRQVHLIPDELLAELRERGFDVRPGVMGENVTTRDIDLIALPRGTRLLLGSQALVELTGLRNPCSQLDGHQPGLMKATLDRAPDGALIRRAGVMAVVLRGGEVVAGDEIVVLLPDGEAQPLEPV